jgi:hypothetical protein
MVESNQEKLTRCIRVYFPRSVGEGGLCRHRRKARQTLGSTMVVGVIFASEVGLKHHAALTSHSHTYEPIVIYLKGLLILLLIL